MTVSNTEDVIVLILSALFVAGMIIPTFNNWRNNRKPPAPSA